MDKLKSFYGSAIKTIYGLTDCQNYVREATNNESWGPTSKQQQTIGNYTFH